MVVIFSVKITRPCRAKISYSIQDLNVGSSHRHWSDPRPRRLRWGRVPTQTTDSHTHTPPSLSSHLAIRDWDDVAFFFLRRSIFIFIQREQTFCLQRRGESALLLNSKRVLAWRRTVLCEKKPEKLKERPQPPSTAKSWWWGEWELKWRDAEALYLK